MSKEGFFSKANRALLVEPLSLRNPVTVLILGICSSLAVTVKLNTESYPNHCSVGCGGCPCYFGRSGAKSLRVRREPTALRLCRAYYYELYHYGTYRGFCTWQ